MPLACVISAAKLKALEEKVEKLQLEMDNMHKHSVAMSIDNIKGMFERVLAMTFCFFYKFTKTGISYSPVVESTN